MSQRLQNEVNDLRREVDAQAREIVALQAAVTEMQGLLRGMTRQSTPKGKAA